MYHNRSSAGQSVEEKIMRVTVDCVMHRLLFQTPSYLAAESGFNRSVDAFGRVAGSRPGKDVSHFGTFGRRQSGQAQGNGRLPEGVRLVFSGNLCCLRPFAC